MVAAAGGSPASTHERPRKKEQAATNTVALVAIPSITAGSGGPNALLDTCRRAAAAPSRDSLHHNRLETGDGSRIPTPILLCDAIGQFREPKQYRQLMRYFSAKKRATPKRPPKKTPCDSASLASLR